MWSQFLDDYKSTWKVEQKNIAKNMFNAVQDKRKVHLLILLFTKDVIQRIVYDISLLWRLGAHSSTA